MNKKIKSVFSVTMDELMGLWRDYFHPIGVVLIIWDAGRHFEILKNCNLDLKLTEGYNNKALTIEFNNVLEAYEIMDLIDSKGISPFMQVYLNGELLSDNVSP